MEDVYVDTKANLAHRTTKFLKLLLEQSKVIVQTN